MKKIFNLFFTVSALVAFSVSCDKEISTPDEVLTPDPQEQVNPAKVITISATLVDTKVTFDPTFDGNSKPDGMSHTWEAGDKLLVTDASDSSNKKEFTLTSGAGTATGTFSGEALTGDPTSFNVEAIPVGSFETGNMQVQAKDGDTAHLEFVASATGVTDLTNIQLTESSSIIGIIAKLPAGAAETINLLVIETSTDDFVTSTKLTVALTAQEDADSDGILKVYANVPAGWGIPAGSKMFLRFGSTNTDHVVYTRYQEFASAASIEDGKFNYIKMNCSNIDKYAGGADDGTAAHPYLIADKYQMDAIHNLLVANQSLRYFKMIDDIDMTGITWVPLNNVADGSSHFSKYIHFDGDNHTLSNISTSTTPAKYPSIFGVLNGVVTNLKIDHATIYPGPDSSGGNSAVIGGYVGSSDNTTVNPEVSNVTITNSTVGTNSAKGGNYCGIIAGRIGRANTSISNITIQDCEVATTSIVGGLIGTITSSATISGTNAISGTTINGGDNTGGMVGKIDAEVTISGDNTVSGTNVTGTGVVGGVIGFANNLVNVSGCTYTGGKVTATARYAGGIIASTSNYNSVISDCHVEEATIESSSDRAGGFAGLIHTKVQVKGCSVGTSSERVTVKSTQTSATANVGGFVGVNYGTITKNGDVRTKTYVTVTSSNTTTGNSMNIGGFAGYNTGTIEYSDADIVMTGLKGQYIGGFCGILLQSGKIDNCTETGAVTGNNYIGGFVGVIDSATTSITNCTSAGSVTAASSIGGFAGGCTANNKPGTFVGNSTSATVTSSGSNFGGFIGNGVGTFTSNYATGDVVSTGGGNGGGFAGGIWEGSTGSVFSKDYATGNVSGNANLGGLIGYIGGNMTMSDCYATGNVGNTTKRNQKYGGLVGFTSDNATYITEGVTISNCYATGDIIPTFAGGGLIGRIGLATTSVSNCAAWNTTISPNNTGSANWSSGAVVGVAFPKCTLTNNYRNPLMSLTAHWVPAADFNHPDVSSTHPLTDSTGAEMADTATASGQAHYPQYPYHGKVEAGKTLSQLASTTLGWDSDVWDFTGDLPTLK